MQTAVASIDQREWSLSTDDCHTYCSSQYESIFKEHLLRDAYSGVESKVDADSRNDHEDHGQDNEQHLLGTFHGLR